MRYSHKYKLECIELYRQGRWPETPPGTSEHNFRITVRRWVRIVDANESDALQHKNFNKNWIPEEKMELISKVLAGRSNQSVALEAGIHPGMLYLWVRKYKTDGYNGLVNMKKGRPCKKADMKKETNPRPLTASEREELIRLRAENEYIKAENEVNHKRVQRLMHEANLLGKRPKEKYHSYKGDVGKIAANVINRDFKAERPLQKWTTDVSQFNFSWGKCYLSPILDMATNENISYDISLSPNLEQIKRMLDEAFRNFPKVSGLIFHSDYAEEKIMPKTSVYAKNIALSPKIFGIGFYSIQ